MATIATAREYFDQVVAYNLEQYKAQPTSLPAAYNLAGSLFSMHEWVWHSYGDELERQLGVTFRNAAALNAHTQSNCPAFKYLRDLANASKHVSLSKASTQATHISNTSAVESVIGEAIIGISKIERGVVTIRDGSENEDFEDAADEVYEYWKTLLDRLQS
jgi:hypothetical protein